jgi:hypothetical protein
LNHDSHTCVHALVSDDGCVFALLPEIVTRGGTSPDGDAAAAERGMDYLLIIAMRDPDFIFPELLQEFIQNDKIGSPITCFYDPIGLSISPTTLRYMKVTASSKMCNLMRPFTSAISSSRLQTKGSCSHPCIASPLALLQPAQHPRGIQNHIQPTSTVADWMPSPLCS